MQAEIFAACASKTDCSSLIFMRFMEPKELRELCYPYHSLDPAQVIERILEAKGEGEQDLTARSVKILREIMRQDEK